MSGLLFFLEYLKDFRSVGSLIPSSDFLADKIISAISRDARVVVEFGGGQGVLTRAILGHIGADSRLIVFETNALFVDILKQIQDPRLLVVHGSAEELPKHMRELGVPSIDCVVSGLPLVFLQPEMTKRILEVVKNSLTPEGVFVQFQYSLQAHRLLTRTFASVEVMFTPLNIPPAFVYVCKK